MANAKKCDRCGAYCDEPGSKRIGGINIIPVSEGTIYTFDLCEDCLEDLYNFLRLGDEAKNKIRAQKTSSLTKGVINMGETKTLEQFNKELEKLLGDRLSNNNVVCLNNPEIQKLFKEHGLEPITTGILVYKAQR